MKHLTILIKKQKICFNDKRNNKGLLYKTILFCLLLNSPLFVSYLYATNHYWNDVATAFDFDKKIDSIENKIVATAIYPADIIGAMVLNGEKPIEMKADQARAGFIGNYPVIPNGRSSAQYGSKGGRWLFDNGGNLIQFDQNRISYISTSSVTINTSGNYGIKGVVFIGQAIFPKFGVPGTDVGYIKNKRIKIAITKGAPYNAGGTLLTSGLLEIDFNRPVENDVNGPYQFSIKACNFNNTRKLTTSSCLAELYYKDDAAAPFMQGSINRNNYCYKNYNRIVESGSVTFEYTSTPTPPHYNAGDKIYITLVSVFGKDLANVAWEYQMFNVATEIYLSNPTP